ncbi:hypothetical protein QAD02_020183 [Eretmocerus hayati]|uniref:Uncharacterized protein n=1 Tax=Eretmocerus hayati TaxID=131215 RepID=A0ACC2PMY4_9HYME|nr:hypothetical protein QAD02_020183 [Eretmocerus hayati]
MKLPKPRVLLLGLVLASAVLLSLTEASPSIKGRSRKKGSKQYQGQHDINVCDIEQSDAPLYCHCNDNNIAKTEEANCLVFKKLELGDPIWAHFNSQIYIKRLTFTVKSDGSITYVPSAVLRQLKTLNVVSFQHASFNRIPRQTFASLPTLSTINLSKNGITGLEWHTFEVLTNLTELNLDDNQIPDLNRDIFYELPRLQRLYLNHNNITLLRENAFEHLPALIELELSNNRISKFTAQSFQRLDHLQRLDLHNNLIGKLESNCFATLPELQELDLDANSIEHISNHALDGLRQLTKLRLADNKLVTLEPDSLVGAPSINLLNLGNNQLRTLTFDNIKPIIMNFYNNSSIFYLNGFFSDLVEKQWLFLCGWMIQFQPRPSLTRELCVEKFHTSQPNAYLNANLEKTMPGLGNIRVGRANEEERRGGRLCAAQFIAVQKNNQGNRSKDESTVGSASGFFALEDVQQTKAFADEASLAVGRMAIKIRLHPGNGVSSGGRKDMRKGRGGGGQDEVNRESKERGAQSAEWPFARSRLVYPSR